MADNHAEIPRRLLLFVIVWVCWAAVCCNGYGRRPMDTVTYNTIIKCVDGRYLRIPVDQRTSAMKTARVRYWRDRDRFSVQDGILYLDGKRVLKKEEIKSTVLKEMTKNKGGGRRKLRCLLQNTFSGISEQSVGRVLDGSKAHQRLNVRFTNRARVIPITASRIMQRLQIDLVDLGKITYRGENYRYGLTLQDVFSRYLWLKPLKTKHSKKIAFYLKRIFLQHGTPEYLQSDNGKEFKGALKRLCRRMNIKCVNCAPYHPQSQGKVERSHRTLRAKILGDLVMHARRGKNWVHEMQNYAKIINNSPREELAYSSPFQVYYGRTHREYITKSIPELEIHAKETDFNDLWCLAKQRHTLHSRAKAATDRVNQRTVLYHASKSAKSIFEQGEMVLYRWCRRRLQAGSSRQCIVEARIVDVSRAKSGRYKIVFIKPSEPGKTTVTKWVSVSDLAALTRQRSVMAKKRVANSKFFIVEEGFDWIGRHGFVVRFDPEKNGDCQFASVADQLADVGVHRSPETLRSEIVTDIRNRPFLRDGTPLNVFLGGNNLNYYVESMGREGTHGDHITLQRTCELFNVQFVVFSSLGPQATRVVSVDGVFDMGRPTLWLAHIAEGAGEHYASASPITVNDRELVLQYLQGAQGTGNEQDAQGTGNEQGAQGTGNEHEDNDNGHTDYSEYLPSLVHERIVEYSL